MNLKKNITFNLYSIHLWKTVVEKNNIYDHLLFNNINV